jgi:phage terminase small subunit
MATADDYKKDIVRKMKSVGTYNISFQHSIDVLSRTLYDYEIAVKNFESSGSHIIVKHTNKNGSTNVVKNPLYLAIEKLRDDVLSYSRELGLTPAGLKRINEQGMMPEKKSKFEEFLSAKTEARKGS